MSLRPTWYIYQVLGHLKLHSEILPHTKNLKFRDLWRNLEFIFQNIQLRAVRVFLSYWISTLAKQLLRENAICTNHLSTWHSYSPLEQNMHPDLFDIFCRLGYHFFAHNYWYNLSKLYPVGIVFKKISSVTNFIGGL